MTKTLERGRGARASARSAFAGSLSPLALALPHHEITGNLDGPAIVVLGGISADSHIRSSDFDPRPGWWESVFGSRVLASDSRLVGIDFLDGGCAPDGRPEHVVTTHDQADAIASVLDAAGIDKLYALIGASYGGMVALAFAERYPRLVERLVVIGAAHRPHPFTTGLRAIQRRIVELGLDTGRERDALVLARALGMTTYRTPREFAERFSCRPEEGSDEGSAVVFPVERYLLHKGQRFAARFTPARFLALSLSSDLHSVDPSRITATTTLVAAEGDMNVPRELTVELLHLLAGPARLVDLPGKTGHDAFLTEPDALGPILIEALNWTVS